LIPRDRDWLARRAKGPATIGGKPAPRLSSNSGEQPSGFFHWIEAANARQEHDYCRFMREMFLRKYRGIAAAIKKTARALGKKRIVGFDVTKQPLLGWQIQLAFDGIGDGQSFPNILLLSGSYDTAALLDDPNLDLVFTPADYHARTVGFAYEAEGLSDSLVLRGKPMLIENDARTWVGSGRHEQGAFRTPKEAEAGLLRNAGLTMSRGLQSYWCNVGSSYFHDPVLQQIVGKIARLLERHAQTQHRETDDAIAFVIDDESLFTEDFTSGYLTQAVIWQRILGLAHCGIPYRLFLWSDLKRAEMPKYKVWFFPNLFILNETRLALLREKVLRDGNLAIFGPATGISDGEILTADWASRLLKVKMDLIPRTAPRRVIVQDNGHPLTRPLPASLTFGDSLPYGPILVPAEGAVEEAGAVALGYATLCWFINRTGLFLKEEGQGSRGNGKAGDRGPDDYAMLWTCALPLTANLLREACRYAGCHVWCEEDDVIYANANLVCLHSVKAGPRTIRLPRACRVKNALTGQEVPTRQNALEVKIDPPQTFIFYLE
ncbi:MAG: hypothetical protein N3A66_03495, partial [Planctomycetota bacterium]|nr:hypothetical protein [Planctomycetota bacterium]